MIELCFSCIAWTWQSKWLHSLFKLIINHNSIPDHCTAPSAVPAPSCAPSVLPPSPSAVPPYHAGTDLAAGAQALPSGGAAADMQRPAAESGEKGTGAAGVALEEAAGKAAAEERHAVAAAGLPTRLVDFDLKEEVAAAVAPSFAAAAAEQALVAAAAAVEAESSSPRKCPGTAYHRHPDPKRAWR